MPVMMIAEDDLPAEGALASALEGVAPGGPVVVMIHGFRYDPARPIADPRRLIYAPCPGGGLSWSRHLRLDGPGSLGIGFAWSAGGTIWQARRRSARAGRRLALLLRRLDAAGGGRPIHLFAHSLGARVGLLAAAGAPGAVRRAILLAPAMDRAEARRALEAADGTEVLSVTARANLAFDVLLRMALPHRGPTLAGGIGEPCPGWLDLSLDDDEALVQLGARVRPGQGRVCHWGTYLRPGVWPLYRAVLAPDAPPLAQPLASPLAPAARGATLGSASAAGDRHARPHRRPLLAHP